VPNLFGKDEIPAILDSVRKAALQAGLDETPDILWKYFIDRDESHRRQRQLEEQVQDVPWSGQLHHHRLVPHLAGRGSPLL
jgi:hypothetical protein